MTRGTLAGLGLGLSALLLGLPLAHLERVAINEPTPAVIVYLLTLLPLPALIAAVHSLHPRFTLFLFPVSHLPALVVEPRLLGPLVYSGGAGFLAQGLICVAFALWIVMVLRAPNREDSAPESPGWLAALGDGGGLVYYPVAILAAFVTAALADSTPGAPGHAQVTILSGALVAGWVGVRWIDGELMRLNQDIERKRRMFAELLVVRRFSPSVFWTFSGVAFALGSLLALVYGGVT
ncbi:MAG: hypothetical protein VYE15_05710 [Myxococcota bacterium]|nr:hypothetical protein [Myxococcota bacterium]